MSSSRPDLSRTGLGVGWVGWKNFACRTVLVSLLVVEQHSNPIFLSIRAIVRSSVEVEVTCKLFRIGLLEFFSLTTFGKQQAGSIP